MGPAGTAKPQAAASESGLFRYQSRKSRIWGLGQQDGRGAPARRVPDITSRTLSTLLHRFRRSYIRCLIRRRICKWQTGRATCWRLVDLFARDSTTLALVSVTFPACHDWSSLIATSLQLFAFVIPNILASASFQLSKYSIIHSGCHFHL